MSIFSCNSLFYSSVIIDTSGFRNQGAYEYENYVKTEVQVPWEIADIGILSTHFQ